MIRLSLPSREFYPHSTRKLRWSDNAAVVFLMDGLGGDPPAILSAILAQRKIVTLPFGLKLPTVAPSLRLKEGTPFRQHRPA
jgi:hypothetical protein